MKKAAMALDFIYLDTGSHLEDGRRGLIQKLGCVDLFSLKKH
jgi:hypothetical protein